MGSNYIIQDTINVCSYCCEDDATFKQVQPTCQTLSVHFSAISEVYCEKCKLCCMLRVKNDCRPVQEWLQTKGKEASRDGWRAAVTPHHFAIVYILSQILYNNSVKENEPFFYLPDPTDAVKIYWKSGEAVAYYAVKHKGSLVVAHNQVYSFNTLDTAYVLPRCRRLGIGVSMLLDMIKDFPGDDLALSSPVSKSMAHVARKFLFMEPTYKNKLWEVDGVGDRGNRRLLCYSFINILR